VRVWRHTTSHTKRVKKEMSHQYTEVEGRLNPYDDDTPRAKPIGITSSSRVEPMSILILLLIARKRRQEGHAKWRIANREKDRERKRRHYRRNHERVVLQNKLSRIRTDYYMRNRHKILPRLAEKRRVAKEHQLTEAP